MTAAVFLAVKLPEREAEHLPPSNNEGQNAWSCTPLAHMASWNEQIYAYDIGLVNNYAIVHKNCGPDSSVGIATDYGLDGPGSNPKKK